MTLRDVFGDIIEAGSFIPEVGASAADVESLNAYAVQTCGQGLPVDYVEFLSCSNGITGRGPNLFVTLDSSNEVPASTIGYGATEYTPGLLIIGGDGLGCVLGIDLRANRLAQYVRMDANSIDWEDELYRCDSLIGLLSYLADEAQE